MTEPVRLRFVAPEQVPDRRRAATSQHRDRFTLVRSVDVHQSDRPPRFAADLVHERLDVDVHGLRCRHHRSLPARRSAHVEQDLDDPADVVRRAGLDHEDRGGRRCRATHQQVEDVVLTQAQTVERTVEERPHAGRRGATKQYLPPSGRPDGDAECLVRVVVTLMADGAARRPPEQADTNLVIGREVRRSWQRKVHLSPQSVVCHLSNFNFGSNRHEWCNC